MLYEALFGAKPLSTSYISNPLIVSSCQYCPVAAVAVGVFACAIRSGVVNAPTAPPVITSLTIIVPRVFAC